MDIKGIGSKIKDAVSKYRYAAIVLLVGIGLLLIPKGTKNTPIVNIEPKTGVQTFEINELSEILQAIEGAGRVKVLLSFASGEKTIYQMDSDRNASGDAESEKQTTVIVTDAQRAEKGLISQVNPPTYLGAIVVCEGADNATVRLAVTQAVSKITGLRTDNICVLKMQS